MKKIKLFNDYGAYPIWIYDEKNILIINDLPSELSNNNNAIELRDFLTNEYEKLFINNSYEFSFKGFKTEESKNKFINCANKFYELLNKEVGHKYIIENNLLKDLSTKDDKK